MDDKYIEVGVDDFDETSSEQPLIYTRDVKTCIVVLLHRETTTILLHIECINDEMKDSNYKDVLNELNDEIVSIDLFKGPYTKEEHICKLLSLAEEKDISTSVHELNVDEYGSSSLGYDENTHSYFDVIMERGIPKFIPSMLNKSIK